MLVRILFLIAIVGLVIFLLKRGKTQPEPAQPPTRNETAESKGELIVPCKQCGIHLPKSEAIQEKDAFFCSEQHLKLSNQQNSEH